MSAEPQEKRLRTPLKLGYWKLRGLGQHIRLLLAYTETEFEDVLYEQGDAPDYSPEQWRSVKFTLGLDFPNLPYLVDGDTKLTQSMAIFHHIARKHDLCGKTEEQKCAVEMLEFELIDIKMILVRYCFNLPAQSPPRDQFISNAKERIKKVSEYIGDKAWSTGSEIVSADILLYEVMDKYRVFELTILDDFPNIKVLVDKFEALPAIAEYMRSDRFIRRPVLSKTVKWPENL